MLDKASDSSGEYLYLRRLRLISPCPSRTSSLLSIADMSTTQCVESATDRPYLHISSISDAMPLSGSGIANHFVAQICMSYIAV
jgi:hypothetical protein